MKRGLCLIAILIFSTLSLPAHAVTLRYALKKGAEITYREQVASASRTSGLGDEKFEITSRLERTYRLRVVEVSAEGEMTIEQEVLSGSLKVSDGEEEHQFPLPKAGVRFKLSPLGKVIFVAAIGPEAAPTKSAEGEESDDQDAAAAAALAPGAMGSLGSTQLDFLSVGVFLPLPEKEVKVGDVWEEEISLSAEALSSLTIGESQPSSLKVKSELVELTERGGQKCARIKVSYELPMRSSGNLSEEEVKVTMSGRIAGEAELLFDYQNGCTPTAQGSFQMMTKISTEFPPEMAEEIPPELSGDTTYALKANVKTVLVTQ